MTAISRVIREFLWKQTTALIIKSHQISKAFSAHPDKLKEGSIEIIRAQLSTVACLISDMSLHYKNAALKHNMVTIHMVKKILRLQNDNFKLSWDLFSLDCYFPN